MDQPKSVTSMARGVGGSKAEWGWSREITWRGLGLPAVVVILPFGWVLPIMQLARVRVSTRRRTTLYSN